MVLVSVAAVAALLSTTAYAWTGHAAKECRQITPKSRSSEDRSYMRDPNTGNCFVSLDVCMDYYHPSPSEMYITLTNKGHNAFVCLSDDNNWQSCVQTSAGVPCNAGVPISGARIYASLHLTL